MAFERVSEFAHESCKAVPSGPGKEMVKRFGRFWGRKGDGEKVLAPSGLGKKMVKRFGPVWVWKGDGEKVLPGLGPERR